jgi:hypothetical protein
MASATNSRLRSPFAVSLLLIAFCAGPVSAQQREPSGAPGNAAAAQQPAPGSTATSQIPGDLQAAPNKLAHRFWDKQDCWLFAGVGAVRALDGISTRNFRARGRDEALLNNEVVDNAAAFAAIEAAGTAASIGASYLLHRTGHHALERWISYVHIGVGLFGTGRNYALKTGHPVTAPH